jgi:hypothetical protein
MDVVDMAVVGMVADKDAVDMAVVGMVVADMVEVGMVADMVVGKEVDMSRRQEGNLSLLL